MTARKAIGATIQPEVAGVLKDFAAIAQVDTDQAESEDAERQLEELVDYARLAAISLVQDAINSKELEA
jgi:uncharacterized protein YgfB (UPF0149 family)